jgi:hypothetical protein
LRPILFLVSAASSYRLLKFVAEHLAREGRPVAFLYERGHDELFEVIQRDARALGAEAYAFAPLIDPRSRSGPVWRRHPRLRDAIAIWAKVVLMIPGLRPAGDAGRVRELRAILAAQLAAARRLLSTLQPSAIVAGEDGISAPLAIHAAARHAGIRVVVVPFGYGVRRDLETALDAKAAHGELVTATGRWGGLIRARAPHWIKAGAHAGALMYEAAYIVAAESLGITLRDPWIIHGGYADRLCVESEQMGAVYRSEGIPESKLVPTGTPYCDVMVRALERNAAARAAVRQPRRIDPGVTRVLVSWPPSYHADRGALSEFPSYREMSVSVLGWLSRLPGCSVTVSLHPATLAADRAALIENGVRLSDDYVIELIPQHDVFVTYFSSTIRWAVAAGKPVINFDLYKLGLTVFDNAPGVLTVASFTDFQREMTQLATEESAFADAARRQIAAAPAWGTLDGLNTARVIAAITG